MKTLQLTAAAGLLLVACPAHAVPTLLPLLPLLGALIAKGVLLFSSVFFLVLSYIRERKKLYIGIGIVLFIIFALAMVFMRHA